jgi:Fe-S-cluster-containing dehydrogenase component
MTDDDRRVRPMFILDLDRCIGCWACAVAWTMKNALPDGVWWIRIEGSSSPTASSSEATTIVGQAGFTPVIDTCVYGPHAARTAVVPACAAACPTNVIEFGDGNDPASAVSLRLNSDPTYPTTPPAGGQPEVRYRASRAQNVQRRSGIGPTHSRRAPGSA